MKLDILAIVAHPDDVELACAGTLMVHAAQGMKIGILDLTKGELGTRGTPEIRAAEAAGSARIMELDVRENLGLPDGFFRNDTEEQLKVITMIRKYRPEIVLTNAREDRHPDHGRAAVLVADSCFLSGLRRIETESDGQSQEAWRPKQVFHMLQNKIESPDFVVDITSVIERKKEAIRSFKTQFLAPAADNEPATFISSPAFFENIISRDRSFGQLVGVPYAEGFTTAKMLGINSFKDLINNVT